MSKNLLHVLRHGQFVRGEDGGDGVLTALGRRQARRTAARLGERNIARVYSSDLQRSRETAEVIAAKLSGISVTALPMLREVLPTGIRGRHVPLEKRRVGRQGIEQVMARFFVKPPRSGDTVLVCHGNLIRALLCRTLGAPITRWYQMGISHCAFTTFSFGTHGQIRLQCFNDTGHLASVLTTSS